jgi:CP family cyanate transporter-like MFS transporter
VTDPVRPTRAGGPIPAVGGALALAAVLVLAFNLRGPLAVVPPVLGDLRADLGLSRSTAGLVTALPVLCFGVLATPAARLLRRFRLDAVVMASAGLLVVALLVRSFGGLPGLLVGTLLLGAALTAGNVLVPVVVKRDFADRAATVTGLYVTALTGGAAVGAAMSLPLAHGAGWSWQGAMASWAAPALLALLLLLAAGRARPAAAAIVPVVAGHSAGVWRSPVAWQLAGYTAVQSLLFYAVLTWLPSLLVDGGIAPGAAAQALVIYTAVGVPAALCAPLLARGRRDQRVLLLAPAVLWLAGLAGLLAAPAAWPLITVLLALGQGAGLSLALAQVPLRATTAGVTARLSAMTQSTGYVLAAGGPWLLGALRDHTGDWHLPVLLLLVLCAVMGAAGLAVGRPAARVGEPAPPDAL